VALLSGLEEVAGIEVEAGQLRQSVANYRQQLDELVASNPEHVTMVRQLEETYDAEAGLSAGPLATSMLPTGDELAAELERFLREQDS
jgi:hypothetical protein